MTENQVSKGCVICLKCGRNLAFEDQKYQILKIGGKTKTYTGDISCEKCYLENRFSKSYRLDDNYGDLHFDIKKHEIGKIIEYNLDITCSIPYINLNFCINEREFNQLNEEIKKNHQEQDNNYISKKELFKDLYQIYHAGNSDLRFDALKEYVFNLEKDLEEKGCFSVLIVIMKKKKNFQRRRSFLNG